MLERVTVNPESFMPRASTAPMIQGNPFMTGFNAETQRADQAEERDLRIENARETADVARTDRANKNAFNSGLSDVISIADPAERARRTAELQARTGQGKDALTTLGTEDTRRKGLEDKALTAYSAGQIALGDQYATQAGVVIPEAIKHDGAMAGGIKMARDAGYTDPQQAATFAVNYKQTRDVKAATDAAGPPRAKPVEYAPSFQVFNQPNGDGTFTPYRFDQRHGTAEPIPGAHQGPLMRPGAGAGAGGSNSLATFEGKRQVWLAIPGKENDFEGAALFAGGKRQMTWPEARQAAAVTVRNLKGPYGPLYENEAAVTSAIERLASQIMGVQIPAGAAEPPVSPLSTVTPRPAVTPSPFPTIYDPSVPNPAGAAPQPAAVAAPAPAPGAGRFEYVTGGGAIGEATEEQLRNMTTEELTEYLRQASGSTTMQPGVVHQGVR